MNSSYLQFVFAMVLVINGIMCESDQGMLHCEYRGNDGRRTFTVTADADEQKKALQKVPLDINANITCSASDTWHGEAWFSFEIVCPVEWRVLLQVSPMDIDNGIVVEAFDDEEVEHSISSENHPSNYPFFLLSKNNFLEIIAKYSDDIMQNKKFMLSARTAKVIEQLIIDHDFSDSPCEDVSSQRPGNGPRKLSCPTKSPYDIVLVTFGYRFPESSINTNEYLTIICWEFDGQPVVRVPPRFRMRASCSRTPSTLLVELMAPGTFEIFDIILETIDFAPDTGKSTTASIGVSTVFVIVLVAVFLLVVLAATVWYKRRNRQASAHAENVSAHNGPYLHKHVSSEGGDATDKSPRYVTSNAGSEGDGTGASNIRSTVTQNEDTVAYSEIGEQDYNTLFGGKERDDYHEYNVPDRPQGKTSVDRTIASGSGPYQELLQDGTRAVAAVNGSPEVTVPGHGVADDLHAYQDLRQDDRSVSGIHPNGEMPNQLPSKDTPATENGYQALKNAMPEYATLELSPEYTALEQNNQSMKGTSDVLSDKQYDTLQRSLNTVAQPPSAGYGTLKPINETNADYESPDDKPKTTSDFEDPNRPTDALPINQPETRHPGSYDDDDYQTPIEPAEDLTNAYQTLDNPGYQHEPDTQADEYSHLQRSLGAKI